MKKFCLFFITVLFITYGGMAAAERVAVKVPLANLRSGPGTHHKLLWKVEKYHPLEVIKKTDKWYLVKDFEGDKGWMFQDLVGNFETVIVKKDKCNVRSGPDTNSQILFTVETGVPFKVLEHKGDWLHIQHSDGDKGWIHKALVW